MLSTRKDIHRSILPAFQKNEVHHTVLNFILKDTRIRNFLKWYILSRIPTTPSRVRVVNRCVVTGNTQSVYRFAHVSRHFLRANSFLSLLPGLRKSYW